MSAASRRAAARLVCVDRDHPDWRTSLADTRTALCIGRRYRAARDLWTTRRPEYVDPGDWPDTA